MPYPINVSLMNIFYYTAVNVQANVIVNVAASPGVDSTTGLVDYQSLVNAIMLRGYWNGRSFIPASQIITITVS